jgi:hypothetical protein
VQLVRILPQVPAKRKRKEGIAVDQPSRRPSGERVLAANPSRFTEAVDADPNVATDAFGSLYRFSVNEPETRYDRPAGTLDTGHAACSSA